MSRRVPMIIVGLVIVVVIASVMCAFQVRFTDKVVVTRFDTIKAAQPETPGLHFKLPWPIERVYRYDSRLRNFETEFRQLATGDQKTLILTAFATWRIENPQTFLKAVGREEAANTKIRDVLENQVSLVLRSYRLDELVNIDPAKIKYVDIEKAFRDGVDGRPGVRSAAMSKYGIDIVSVGIKRLGLPESVTREVFNRMKEERQKTINELNAQGEAEARRITANAREVANRIMARTEAYAKTIEGRGEAEAAKYYTTFKENPWFAAFLKKLESLDTIFKAGQITLVLDAAQIAPFDLLDDARKLGAAMTPESRAGADETDAEPVDVAAADDESSETRSPNP